MDIILDFRCIEVWLVIKDVGNDSTITKLDVILRMIIENISANLRSQEVCSKTWLV